LWVAVAALATLVAGVTVPAAPAFASKPLPAGSYVVSFHAKDQIASVTKALGIDPTARYGSAIAGLSAHLTAAQATKLAQDPRIAGITKASTTVTGQSQFVPAQVGTVQANQAPVNAGNGSGTWNGPAIAIVDSGVNADTDYNLKQQVNCFGSGTADDANGHGTGVAGVAAAYDNSYGTVGIAPGAPIYSVRILDDKNKGSIQTLVCGLNWVAANAAADDIKVLNLSLGAPGADDNNCGYTNGDVVHQAICGLAAQGVTVVVSAVNDGKNFANYIPASYSEVLTATNVADYDGKPGGKGTPPCAVTPPDDSPAPSSNYAVDPSDQAHTLAAPGVCPYTTQKGNRYGYIQSGTSMSAAALSGVVLDCLAAGGGCDPGGSAASVRDTVIAQSKAQAEKGHSFTGDPLHPIAGKYYGYLASTIPLSGSSTPTPTPTPTPTGTPTPTPTPTPTQTPPPKDTIPPVVTVTSPASGSTVSGSVTLIASASDDSPTGVKSVSFYSGTLKVADATKQSSGLWQATVNSRSYPNGSYPFVAKATDFAGNVGISPSITVTLHN
jgi:hypothetical protein